MKHEGFVSIALLLTASMLPAAEMAAPGDMARLANDRFHQGDYKKARKLLEKAVQLDSTNADYREALGRTYEREAEQSSAPFFLNNKARLSFIRALELQPSNSAALTDLIELATQPIGLCEGNLDEAAALVDRLAQVDPQAARRQKEYLDDAKREAAKPGQRALCGPVKVSRVVTNRIFPLGAVKMAGASPTKPDDTAVNHAKPSETAAVLAAGQ
jgi:tetratricopeptide (TPR) repeat protein